MELRKHIRKILAEAFFDPNKVFTGGQVSGHIEKITPNYEDLPFNFMENDIDPRKFKLKEISIEDLLKSDPDFNDYYYLEPEERYDQEDMNPEDLYNELVVVDGRLLDGYNRAKVLLRRGEKTAIAFVAL